MNRDGKGVYDVESRKPTLRFFFVLTKRKFPQLLQLNLMMLFQVIPIAVILGLYFLGNKTPIADEAAYAPLYGITKILPSSSLTGLLDFASTQIQIPIISPWAMVIMLIMGLFLAITFGWQNVGAAYVLRGLYRGDAVFVFSDYFYAIKRNLKQGLFLGLIDFTCCAALAIDFVYYYFRTGSFGLDVMFFGISALAIIYIAMRFYMYQLLVTFDLKNLKILKNSLIFSVLGIKRNVMAYIGLILLLALHIFLIIWLFPMGISIPLVIPFVYILGLIGFITVYAAYPVIDRYMIQPYENNSSDEDDSDSASEDEQEVPAES